MGISTTRDPKLKQWYEAKELQKESKVYVGATYKDLTSNFIEVNRYYFGRTLLNISFYEMYECHTYKRGWFDTDICRSEVDRYGKTCFILKEDLEPVIKNWVAVPEKEAELIPALTSKNIDVFKNWVVTKTGMIADPKDIELATSMLANPLKPFVIKGTDWPYWFKANDALIASTTSSWFRFLYDKCGVLTPAWLEEYTGEDKEKEHLEKSKG